MEITGEIYHVGGDHLSAPGDAAIYLIRFGGESALVDSGCGEGTERLLANIRGRGVDPSKIKYLLITHCHFDHTGGGAELKERFGMETVAHELDARYIEIGDDRVTAANWYGSKLRPFTIDSKITGSKDRIMLGGRAIEIIHAPGHSPGSVVFLTESEGRKVLFGQDVHGPLDSSFLSDRRHYMKSLKMLLELEADILCEGHFGVYKGKDEVAEFIRRFL